MTNERTTLGIRAAMAFVIAATVTIASAAAAYTLSDYYGPKWPADQTWKIGNTYGGVANQAGWTMMTMSDDPWNAVSGAWFDFAYGGRDNSVTWTGNVCTMPSPRAWVITYNVSPLGMIGNTHKCGTSTTLTAMTIQLDDDANWYVSTGTPSGSQYDLLSVAIHEFGHANGFAGPNQGHFPANDTACTTSPIHTMCAGISPGTTYKRTLEVYEKSLFSAAY